MPNSSDRNAPTKITLTIRFNSEKDAQDAASSLEVDDDEYVSTFVEGSTVRGEIVARSVEGARRAADDWLACLMAIVKKD